MSCESTSFKTPERKNTSATPKKSFISLELTPSSRNKICLLCGKHFPNANDRRILIKGGIKTPVCSLLEELLCEDLSSLCTNVVCRYCVGRVDTVKRKLAKLKNDFQLQNECFKEKFGKEKKKRCQPGADSDTHGAAHPSKRKSLSSIFQDISPTKQTLIVSKGTQTEPESTSTSNEGLWVSLILSLYKNKQASNLLIIFIDNKVTGYIIPVPCTKGNNC